MYMARDLIRAWTRLASKRMILGAVISCLTPIAAAQSHDSVDVVASPSLPLDLSLEISAYNAGDELLDCSVTIKAQYRAESDRSESRSLLLRARFEIAPLSELDPILIIGESELRNMGIPGIKYTAATIERKECKAIPLCKSGLRVGEAVSAATPLNLGTIVTSCELRNNSPIEIETASCQSEAYRFDSWKRECEILKCAFDIPVGQNRYQPIQYGEIHQTCELVNGSLVLTEKGFCGPLLYEYDPTVRSCVVFRTKA